VAFPVAPLPSSCIGFGLLRQLWVAVALESVILFIRIILRESRREPAIVLPLLVVAASCAPMILVRTDELYASIIGHSGCLLYAFSAFQGCVRLIWAWTNALRGLPRKPHDLLPWHRFLTCLTYSTLNIRSTASNIKLIRFVPLLQPFMLLGMEPTLATYLACLALKGKLSAFDKCLRLMAGATESSPST
jgi:hypothetical protein